MDQECIDSNIGLRVGTHFEWDTNQLQSTMHSHSQTLLACFWWEIGGTLRTRRKHVFMGRIFNFSAGLKTWRDPGAMTNRSF